MKRLYLFLFGALALFCWEAKAQPAVFPEGETLYFERPGNREGQLRVVFINSANGTPNTTPVEIGDGVSTSITIPAGCYTQVQFHQSDFGNITLSCDPTMNEITFSNWAVADWSGLRGGTYAGSSFICGPPTFPEGMSLFLKVSWNDGVNDHQWDSTADECNNIVQAEFTAPDGTTKKRVSMDMIDLGDHLYKITVPAGTWEEVQFFQTGKSDLLNENWNWTEPLAYEAGKNRINLTGWRESQSTWQSYSPTPGANIFPAGTELYLDANAIWNAYGANMAVSFSNGSGVNDTGKLPMTHLSGSIYAVKIPAGNYTHAQFFCIDPDPNYYLPWHFTLPLTNNLSVNCVRITNTDLGCSNYPGTCDWNAITPPSFFPPATVLYLSTEEFQSWNDDGAVFLAEFSNAGGSVVLPTTFVSGNIYTVTVPTEGYYMNVNFLRVNPADQSEAWNSTGNLSYSPPNDMVEVKGENNNADWNIYVPSVPYFPPGMKLYVTPHGDPGNYFRVVFSGSTAGAPDYEIHLGPISNGFFEITVPAGNYEYVDLGRNDSGNGTPWNWIGTTTYNPEYNWIKITNYFNPGNFSWDYYTPPVPVPLGTKIYLVPNAWQQNGDAYFALCFDGNDGNRKAMTKIHNNLYEYVVSSTVSTPVEFLRVGNSDGSGTIWNRSGQIFDIDDNTAQEYCYAIPGSWSDFNGGNAVFGLYGEAFEYRFGATDGLSPWTFLPFTDNTSSVPNEYILTWKIPANPGSLSFYVAYNKGVASLSPDFLTIDGPSVAHPNRDGQFLPESKTELLSSLIASIPAGNTVILRIVKNAGNVVGATTTSCLNWAITIEDMGNLTSIIQPKSQQAIRYFNDNEILTVNFAGNALVGLYTISGVQIGIKNAIGQAQFSNLNKGLYILKVNNTAYKVVVK